MRPTLILLLLAVVATLNVAAMPSSMTATVDYIVTMGAVDPEVAPNANPPGGEGRLDRFEYMAYYPDRLQLHRGATVHFQRVGWHSVALAPDEAAVPRHLRRDEVDGVSALDGETPTDPSCTTDQSTAPAVPIATACTFDDPGQVLNSGWGSMRVTIDVPPGTYDYWCTIHDGMRGAVVVLPDSEPVPTPAEATALGAAQLAADTSNGEAMLAAGQTPVVEPVGDHRRFHVKAGDFTADGRVAALRFLPSTLEIDAEDEVVFVTPDSPVFEIHTASFPADAYPFGFLTYLHPNCDRDGRSAGAPGVPLQYEALLVGCPPGTDLEIAYQPWAWQQPVRAPADAVATPATVHDSGLLAPGNAPCRSACDPWTGQRFANRSSASFPAAGTFAYICNVHPEWGMSGSITVVS